MSFTFGVRFQTEMLSLMLKDISFADKVVKHVDEEALHSEAHKFLFQKIKKKIEKDGSVPSFIELEDEAKSVERTKRRLFLEFIENVYKTKCSDQDFLKESLTEYARRMYFTKVFAEAQFIYNSQDYQQCFDYTLESMTNLYGIDFADTAPITVGDFEKIRQRHLRQASLGRRQFLTGIDELDEVLTGGLSKGELGLLLGEAKKGKSFGLTHMGAVALMARAGQVAHFVLEGTTEQATMRYQARLTGIETNRLAKDEITKEEQSKLNWIEKSYLDSLEIVPLNQHWEYTVLDIQNKIVDMERRGRKPDLVIIDYADLLKSHRKSDNKLDEQIDVYRYLKQLAMMKDVAIWSGTQAKRSSHAPEKEYILRSKDIADCYERVRIADFVATLNQTPKEKKMGMMRIHADLYRSSDADRTIYSICDFSRAILHKTGWGTIKWIPPRKKRA